LILQNNAAADLAVSANGVFTFGTMVAAGGAYAATVKTQPGSPAQSCVVTNGSGTVGTANVTSIAVTCTTVTYSIGGTVTGLSSSGLVLQLNAGNDLAVSASGAFTFATPLAGGATYTVSVKTQPGGTPAQNCVVSGGSGTVSSSAVTNVAVSCQAVAGPTPQFGTYAYVTNLDSNNVSVISTTTSSVTKTMPVGLGPRGVAITPDGAVAYVTNSGSNSVSVIDTFTNSLITTVTVGTGPRGVAITPNGAFAYVTNTASNNVSVISTSSNTVTATVAMGAGSAPVAVAITPNGTRAYVANSSTGRVAVINTVTNAVVASITVAAQPQAIAITPNGAAAYVACQGAEVSIIDTATNLVSTHVLMGSGIGPSGVAITPNGISAYVARYFSNDVIVINTPTKAVTATIKGLGSLPTAVAIAPDGSNAYVANHNSHTLSVINTTSNVVTPTIGVGDSPSAVAIATIAPFNFRGFISPIGNPPVLNAFSAGATIAAKFSLGGVLRLSIFAAGYPKSQQIACDTLLPIGAIEGPTNPGPNDLTYDALLDLYSYAWKTDKAWTDTCRQLIVRLSDLTDHTAYFKLSK
jgi:YVTN family beta-propeller protein